MKLRHYKRVEEKREYVRVPGAAYPPRPATYHGWMFPSGLLDRPPLKARSELALVTCSSYADVEKAV
ncbi:MAG: hypothetical protein ACE5PO_04500, partial [Candidatus Bathyarchaeia archaeon]